MIKPNLSLPINLTLATIIGIATGLTGCDKKDQETINTTKAVATDQQSEQALTANNAATDDALTQNNMADTNAISETTVSNANANTDNALATVLPDNTPESALANNQPSLVANPVEPNTPEATVKIALDTLYYGNAQDAVKYYQVNLPNFDKELAKTQYAFQQTVAGVSLTNTTYNDDKTRAKIEGELMLKGQQKPEPLVYELQKINGVWKILG